MHAYGNGTTTATSGANTIVHFYDRAGIKAATAVNIYGQFASKKWQPKKHGKTYKISKFLHIYDRNPESDSDFGTLGYMSSRDIDKLTGELAASTLAEGSGPANHKTIEKITVEATLARYGHMIEYSDEVELFSEDVMQVRYREELGEFANSVYEDLVQLDMLATPTVMFAGAAAALTDIGDGTDVDGAEDAEWRVSYDLVRKAVQKLTRNRAKKNTSIVTGSTKVATQPIAAAFYAIIGPEVKYDLENLTRGSGESEEFAYVPVHKYASASQVAQGEVGAMHDVRFIESERAVVYRAQGGEVPAGYTGDLLYSEDSSNVERFDLFPILFPTQDAFATVGLRGEGKIKFNAKAPSDVSLGNPYGTKGFFSYNFFYAGLLLEPEKMLKVLVAAGS